MKKTFLLIGLLVCGMAFAAVEEKTSQEISLKKGWNLVTLDRPLAANADGAEKFLDYGPLRLDAERGCYVRCTTQADLKAGAAYWIFSKEAKPLVLAFNPNQQTWETAGWSGNHWKLLGVAENSNWQSQATELWQWLNGQYQTITKEALDNGKAYWAK